MSPKQVISLNINYEIGESASNIFVNRVDLARVYRQSLNTYTVEE
jgi:hypothetical protein